VAFGLRSGESIKSQKNIVCSKHGTHEGEKMKTDKERSWEQIEGA
jgi:hypothetical protein